jgi:hypothetical protein
MNALPLKPRVSLRDAIDQLIIDYGFRSVILAIAGRVLKRSRPPDSALMPDLKKQPGIDVLDNRMREDIGLPPLSTQRSLIELGFMVRRDLF